MNCFKEYMEDWIEKIYLNHKILISMLLSIIVTILYHLNAITNIRENISNIIDLAAALMVVITLILTILLYLNDKEPYKKKLRVHQDGNNHIYFFIFEITLMNLFSIGILIMINMLNLEIYVVKLVLSFLGTYSFSYMMLGTIYMLWFSIFVVVGVNSTKKKVA